MFVGLWSFGTLEYTPFENLRIVAYPASVIAKYHTPKSKMAEHNRITAVVDYNHIKRDGNDKVAVNVGESPTYIQDVELYPDSVQCNYVEGK